MPEKMANQARMATNTMMRGMISKKVVVRLWIVGMCLLCTWQVGRPCPKIVDHILKGSGDRDGAKSLR